MHVPPMDSFACETSRRAIVALIDGELAADERGVIRDHIDACESCASFYESTTALLNTMGSIGLEMPVTDVPGDLRVESVLPGDSWAAARMTVELKAMHSEMQAMRAELAEVRRQLAALGGQLARTPPRPAAVARTLFPYSAPADRLRQDS